MSVAGGRSTRQDGANAWPPFFFNDRRESQDWGSGDGTPSDCRCRFRPASFRPCQVICAVVDFLDSFEESSSPMSTTPKYVYTFGSGKADGRSDMKDLLGGKGAN